jgi:hypothetical protein
MKENEELDLVRVQLWKTKVGSKECKPPDLDDTRIDCLPCAENGQIKIGKSEWG